MCVVMAVAALQALLEQPSQQLLAVSADGGARVAVHFEGVGYPERGLRPGAGHGPRAGRGPTVLPQLEIHIASGTAAVS